MKKAVIAVFSVSLTAGTIYLTYSQLKLHLIKKLIGSWQAEAKKQNKKLAEDQIKLLTQELDKLYIWEVRWLASYSAKKFAKAPEKELAAAADKLKKKGILDRANLKAIEPMLFEPNI